MLTSTGEVRPLEEMETEIIRFAISHYRGQMSEVARRLKIGRSTLYRKLDEAAANELADGAQDELSAADGDCGARVAKAVTPTAMSSEPSNRGLPVTDKRQARGKTAQPELQTGGLRSVCRELPRMALAA